MDVRLLIFEPPHAAQVALSSAFTRVHFLQIHSSLLQTLAGKNWKSASILWRKGSPYDEDVLDLRLGGVYLTESLLTVINEPSETRVSQILHLRTEDGFSANEHLSQVQKVVVFF